MNIVILNWQRPLWEGDQEVVKRSGRGEPIWVVIQMCMEAMLGISLYRYPYLEPAKMPCFSYYLLCFFFNNIEEGRIGSAQRQGRGDVAKIMYAHEVHVKTIK
jgi:hypothetical protein